MNTPSSRLVCGMLGSALILIAPAVSADGGGGTMGGNSMPSQSAPRYDATVEFKKGVDALKAGQNQDAENAFSHVLEVNSRDANTHFMMGLAESGQGKFKDARSHYEKAVKYNDNLILAHLELGVTLAKLGETDKANAVLDDLKKRAAACADTCQQAADLRSAVPALESALAPPASPASSASPSPASSPSAQVPAEQELLTTSIDSGDRDYLEAVSLINDDVTSAVPGTPERPGNWKSGLLRPLRWQPLQERPARAACPPSSSGVRTAARPIAIRRVNAGSGEGNRHSLGS